MREIALTTVDNPYDPINEFPEWYAFDRRAGRDTAGFLARIYRGSPALPPAYQEAAMEEAIDEIVEYNVTGLYRKIDREVPGNEPVGP